MNNPELKPNAAKSEGPPGSVSGPSAPAKRPRWALAFIVCLALAVIALLLLHHGPAAQANRAKAGATLPAVQVPAAVVQKGDMGVYLDALIGTVIPVYTAQVKSRVDGQLMSVSYVEGQMVREGDPLVEIDPRPYQAQLTQAEGQLARDQALLTNAWLDLDRYQKSYSEAEKSIPKQQLDTQKATVHQYEGIVKLDQGQVDNAKLQVTYSHINAPISGRVGFRLVDPGNIVHATDTNPLAVITQLQPITVVFSVRQDDLPQVLEPLRQGQKLSVEAYDRDQKKKIATGTVLTPDNQVDVGTGTFKIKAMFTNEDNCLFPNQFVRVRLILRTEHDATLVRTEAIQRNPQGPFVYVIQTNQTVTMRPVSLGAANETMTAVGGVEPGEVIATDNFNRLMEGAKVAVSKPAEPSKPGSGKSAKLALEMPRDSQGQKPK